MQSGGIYSLPAGDFLIQGGRQVGLQYYDSNDGQWHNHGFPGISTYPVYVGSDGTNYRVINMSGTIQGVSMTNNGSAYTAAPTVTFAAPTSGITATGVAIVGGDLTFSVSAGGSGYVNPTVVISPPNSGNAVRATATVSLTSGSLTTVTLVAGAGYTSAPTVTVLDPVGTGGTIVASLGTTNASKVLAIRVTNPGSGYAGTGAPAITFSGGGGTAAAGTAIMSLALSSVTVTTQGSNFSVAPIVTTDGGVIVTSIDSLEAAPFRPAILSSVVTTGTITSITVQDEGFGFQKNPVATYFGSGAAAASNAATLTAVTGGVNTTVKVWQLG
jgi:hypothetical protein